MANIKNHLNNIKNALFGQEVRGSIHDGIDAINKEVESTTNRQEHLEGTFDQLVINSGNSNAEIVDARVGENGKSYAKLGDRLDEVDSQLEHDVTKKKDLPYINILDFGADPTGIKDSTNAIQSAFDSVDDYGRVLIPQGKYRISKTIEITKAFLSIYSNAKDEYHPKIFSVTPNITLMHLKTPGHTIKNISFEGDGVFTYMDDIYDATVNGILIDRNDGTGRETLGNLDVEFLNCIFTKLNNSVSCVGRNVFFYFCTFSNCIKGIEIDKFKVADGEPDSDCRGYRIENCRFHTLGHNNLPLKDGKESYCIDIKTPDSYGNKITGNMIDANGRHFYRGPLDRVLISDNQGYQVFGDFIHVIPNENAWYNGWEICDNTWVANQMYLGGMSNGEQIDETYVNSRVSCEYFIKSHDNCILANGIINSNYFANCRKHGFYLPKLHTCK